MFKIRILIVLAAIAISQIINASDQEIISKIRLVWTDDPSTTISVIWDQEKGKKAKVYYGPEDFGTDWEKYPYKKSVDESHKFYQNMNTYIAELSELEPDKAYYFVIKMDFKNTVTKSYWFRTAPDTPKPFTFIGGGDTKSVGYGYEVSQLSNKMVAKLRPLFVIFVGDFCTGDGTVDEFWELWFNNWSSQTVTNDRRMIPIVPVQGNHEGGDLTVLNKLFNAPYQGGDDRNVFYSLSVGGNLLHITILNSEVENGGLQKEWLENDLKDHKDFTFKIAAYHKPFSPHTSKKKEQDYQYEQWAQLFYNYNVNLSLDADSHTSKITYPLKPSNEEGSFQGFIRDDKEGTMYIGEGSWGVIPRPNNDDKPWTIKSESVNQFKWFHVYPEKEDREAYIEIRTVVTASPDENKNVVSHIDNVGELSEENLFEIPKNINLLSAEPYGTVITYPFKDK